MIIIALINTNCKKKNKNSEKKLELFVLKLGCGNVIYLTIKNKLNRRNKNKTKGMNTWQVSIMKHSGLFQDWAREQRNLAQRTSKYSLNPVDDVDRLLVKREKKSIRQV